MTDGTTGSGAAADGDGAAAAGETDAYGGIFGAFPYAFRASDSRLLRTYVVVGGLIAALVVVLFVLSLVVLVAETVGATGGTFTFSRAFLVVVMVLVVVPLVAPVLFVARRHRRVGSTAGYDRTLAATGYLFVLALYLGLLVSAPESLTDDPGSGPVGALVARLYALPRAGGVVPPLLGAAVVYLAHHRLR